MDSDGLYGELGRACPREARSEEILVDPQEARSSPYRFVLGLVISVGNSNRQRRAR